MIWKRDMYISYLADHEDVGRTMFCELFGPLKQLEDEWRAQGASEDEISLEAFGFDSLDYAWAPVNNGIIPLPEREIERTSEYKILMDSYGRKSKLCFASATIPLPMGYPVETPEDWEKIRPRYAFSPDRVNREKLAELRRRRDEGAHIMMDIPGGFDEPRQLMGEENLCVALYEEPEMIEDMLNTFADTALRNLEIVSSVCPVDQLHIHEDMAGKTGPLLGPNMVREFIAPYYRRLIDAARAQGARIFSQDSDGYMVPDIGAFLESGLNCMYPNEPQAGMDVVAIRKVYGKQLSLKGGIDKFALRKDPAAIREELERKLVPSVTKGGCVLGLDHRIPNGVSIENYRYYVNTAREMLGLEPAHPEKHVRMAF